MASQRESEVQGLILRADNMKRDFKTRKIELEGDVQIIFGEQKLFADKAIIDLEHTAIYAEGNVVLSSGATHTEGEVISYNYSTQLGSIERGFIQSGPVVFEGRHIEKTGEDTYIAKGAKYTACKTCPEAWSFTGTEIEAEIGGYAYIKYPILRVANFPVFVLPRMLVPLKSERQSGLLIPSFGQTRRGGAHLSQDYFWAISRSQDMTFGLKTSERRGLKSSLEYRYVLTPQSSGFLKGSFLKDKVFTADGQTSNQYTTLERGYGQYGHYFVLPDNFIHRMNLNFTSDLRYVRDFSDDLYGHGDPALENRTSITRNTNTQHFSVEAAYYTNLLQEDALATNTNTVHRMPEINYSIMEQNILDTDFLFRFNFNYVNFSRRGFSYDNVSGVDKDQVINPVQDGEFNPSTDLIRTGQRLILSPSISYPFHIGTVFDVVPSVTYNETQYRFDARPSPDDTSQAALSYEKAAQRRFIQADLSAKTTYSRVFGADDQVSNRYKHEIQPELRYSYIPYVERPDHIFFGNFEEQPFSRRLEPVNNDDFFGSSRVQFDYNDRLFDKRVASLLINNNIVQKRYRNDEAYYQRILTFRMAQSYDFNEEKRDRPRPWSPINGLLDIRLDRFETHTVSDYYPYAKIANVSSRMRFKAFSANFLELTYSREIFVDQDSNFDRDQKSENYGLGWMYRNPYLELSGRTSYSGVTNRMTGWEYIATFIPPGDCWSIKFGQRKTVGGDVDYNFSFNFDFGGRS